MYVYQSRKCVYLFNENNEKTSEHNITTAYYQLPFGQKIHYITTVWRLTIELNITFHCKTLNGLYLMPIEFTLNHLTFKSI